MCPSINYFTAERLKEPNGWENVAHKHRYTTLEKDFCYLFWIQKACVVIFLWKPFLAKPFERMGSNIKVTISAMEFFTSWRQSSNFYCEGPIKLFIYRRAKVKYWKSWFKISNATALPNSLWWSWVKKQPNNPRHSCSSLLVENHSGPKHHLHGADNFPVNVFHHGCRNALLKSCDPAVLFCFPPGRSRRLFWITALEAPRVSTSLYEMVEDSDHLVRLH